MPRRLIVYFTSVQNGGGRVNASDVSMPRRAHCVFPKYEKVHGYFNIRVSMPRRAHCVFHPCECETKSYPSVSFNAPKGSFCISPLDGVYLDFILPQFQCPEGLILYFTGVYQYEILTSGQSFNAPKGSFCISPIMRDILFLT